jgi:hypothetical protein
MRRIKPDNQGVNAQMRNIFIGLLVVAALAVGGGFIAQTAYQAGLTTAITTAAANAPDGTVVTPVVPGAYPYGYGYGPGWGWGHGGFSILGFLGTLLFIFLIIGLLRAAFWRGGGSWGNGRRWDGPGKWGDGDHRGRFQQTFDDWHRQAHGESGPSTGPSTGSTPPREPSA